jgi:hypothetical protein
MSLRLPKRSRRGGALVETAVLMVVLVPLILYALFLADLLVFRFDQDEVVYSSPWDFAAFDFRHSSILPNGAKTGGNDVISIVQQLNRNTYADLSSSYQTYNDLTYDQTGPHHQALAAQASWAGTLGEEVTCSLDGNIASSGKTEYGELDGMFIQLTRGNGQIGARHSGGMQTCAARLTVQNYLMPEVFLNYSGKNNLGGSQFTKEYKVGNHGTDVESNARSGSSFAYPEGVFSVLHDPWALNYVRTAAKGTYPRDRTAAHVTVDPANHPDNLNAQNDELSKWMAVPYNGPFGAYTGTLTAATGVFFASATQFILPTLSLTDGSASDNITTPPVAFSPVKETQFRGSYPAAWGDPRAKSMTGPAKDAYFRKSANSW